MNGLYYFLKMLCVITAAFVIGNWFLSEMRKVKMRRLPWYKAYLTVPGILVIIALLSPLFIKYVLR